MLTLFSIKEEEKNYYGFYCILNRKSHGKSRVATGNLGLTIDDFLYIFDLTRSVGTYNVMCYSLSPRKPINFFSNYLPLTKIRPQGIYISFLGIDRPQPSTVPHSQCIRPSIMVTFQKNSPYARCLLYLSFF